MNNNFESQPDSDSDALLRYRSYANEQYLNAKNGDVYAIDECLRIFGERLNRMYNEAIAREIWNKLNNLAKIDNRALYLLGIRNLYGHPFGRAETKGASQVLIAAERGNKSAQYDVALWNMHGMCGLTKDLTAAKKALAGLAEEGMSDAQEMLEVIEHHITKT